MHEPTFRISTDIVNDPDGQASRLLAARTVCKTIMNGSFRLPRPNEFPNQILADVKSTAMAELKSYFAKRRSEEPARFLSSFSGFTFKSPETFNSAPDELKTRAITNEVILEPGALPEHPYMAMIVDKDQ